ncbi:MAG: spore cortex biosynthesis protein YabQ [Clostridia bacterium]|nr:spore cortex biosynthesis protein YabQ [Clostridia bacterium]
MINFFLPSLPSAMTLFSASMIFGIYLGLLYDILSVFKLLVRIRRLLFFADFTFSLICSLSVFIFVYCINEGAYTPYMFIGMLATFLIYNVTVSRVTVRVIITVIGVFCKFFKILYKITVIPAYIALDKFYKKGKINIENKLRVRYEKKLLKLLIKSVHECRKEAVDNGTTSAKKKKTCKSNSKNRFHLHFIGSSHRMRKA